MSEIPKAYEPQSVEDKWYDFWVKQGCFTADPARVSAKRPAYSIVIPPPNVTGMLHMGHVLNNTIQDILSRKARMDGKEVLWLPGTDHAGISTEGMVAKQLRKEGKDKKDVGREEFIKRAWTWKEKHGGIIIQQLKKLGCSCDWTRERFTMDEAYMACVKKVFVELYKKGLIYRGKRMVNWCPVSQTALSDEEVEMKPQKGFMYHFRVQVVENDGTPLKVSGVPLTPTLSSNGGEGETKPGGPTTDRYGMVWLTIATTRPETIPGDTAVAVNPKDKRYAHLIGKHIVRPLPIQLPREQKLIPIIGDEHVDFEFGTGVLKVTPAHDKADFEIGQRHKLPLVDIMNPDGTMNELAGESMAGLDRFEARSQAVERLKEISALVEEKPYENNVGFSQRADVPIEPRLSEQWFLKYPSVEQAKACVVQEGSTGASPVAVGAPADAPKRMTGSDDVGESARPDVPDGASGTAPGAGALPKMQFHPQRWAKVYDHWLTNIQDWCISRQLWWGHRIPVWSKTYDCYDVGCVHSDISDLLTPPPSTDFRYVGNDLPETAIEIEGKRVTSDSKRLLELALELSKKDKEVRGIAARICTIDLDLCKRLEDHGWAQDPDVLDTWFSSWLWPFATMGWPEQTPTLKAFYPTTDLVTGPDIIFFWVARMIMAGYEFMGEPKFGLPDAMPFRNVYFTGIIRDKQGRKMSKTLGNSPDPLELIAKYGADALRFGTMRSAPLGQDVLFDEKDVELGRNFCNKLWNACRFRQMQGGASESEIDPALLSSDDKWILLKLDKAIREIDAAFAGYRFNEVTQTLYRFFWNEYCDWYVEASKAVLQGNDTARKANKLAVIDFVLSHTLRLFHPFLPFISEELWHGLGYHVDLPASQGGDTIMYSHWPKPLDADFKQHYGLDESDERLVETRNELVSQGRNLRREFNIAAGKKVRYIFKPGADVNAQDADVLRLLLNAESLTVDGVYQPPKGTPQVLSPLGELFMPLEGLIDVGAEKARLTKERARVQAEIEKAQAKLNNPKFAQNAPPHILEEHRTRLADWEGKLQQVESALTALEG